jgi:hypothetical protein
LEIDFYDILQEIKDLSLEDMFDVFQKADSTVKLSAKAPTDWKNAEKSAAVPFLLAPKNVKGLPGYKGFDPLGFSDFLDVKWLQEAGYDH